MNGKRASARGLIEDLLYMAKRYVRKSPATESIIFDNETGKTLRTIKYRETIERAEEFLSRPDRNCDVGTPKQQAKRFQKFCLGHQPKEGDCTCACPAFVGEDVDCHFSWAQMPCKARSAK